MHGNKDTTRALPDSGDFRSLPQLLLSGSSFGNNNKVSKIPKVSYAYSLLTIIKHTNQANYTNHKKLQNMQTLQNHEINLTHSQGPQDTAGSIS